MGDSAGGNLAAAVALMARDRGEFSPKTAIFYYPVLNNDYGPSAPFASVAENGHDYILTAEDLQEYLMLYFPIHRMDKRSHCLPLNLVLMGMTRRIH